jgi:asparagine synthase (glutamine-hydrolysing)
LLALAKGGSLLTGFDGDGLLGSWRYSRLGEVLGRKALPRPRDGARLAFALIPPNVRAAIGRRRRSAEPAMTWLASHQRDLVERAHSEQRYGHPVRWDRYVEWLARRRYVVVATASLGLVAGDAGSLLIHPLLDRRFLASLARAGGATGCGNRASLMSALFADVLPHEVLTRRGKAVFDEPMWGPQSDRFIAGWEGSGVDPTLVDIDVLKEAWTRPALRRDARTATLLQAAWVASV